MDEEKRRKLLESVGCIDYAFVKNPKGLYVDLSRVPLDLWDTILKMVKERLLECLIYADRNTVKKLIRDDDKKIKAKNKRGGIKNANK